MAEETTDTEQEAPVYGWSIKPGPAKDKVYTRVTLTTPYPSLFEHRAPSEYADAIADSGQWNP